MLIGDHQPQQVSRRDDGFETPVHIISRDAGFVESLQDYGFVDGLIVQEMQPTLRHEGFYSLFVRDATGQLRPGRQGIARLFARWDRFGSTRRCR